VLQSPGKEESPTQLIIKHTKASNWINVTSIKKIHATKTIVEDEMIFSQITMAVTSDQ